MIKKAIKGTVYFVAWALVVVHEVAAMSQIFDWLDEAFKPKVIDQ
jgi:hypothetical protein